MMAQSLYTKGSLSILSVLFVWLFLGLPVWWNTTRVYRSNLPYASITSLQDEQQVLSCNISIINLINGLDLSFIRNTSNFTIVNKGSVINVLSVIKEYRGHGNPIDQPESIEDILNNHYNESLSASVGHYLLIITPAVGYNTLLYRNERYLIVHYINDTQLREDINGYVHSLCGEDTFNKLINNSNKKESLRRIKVSPGYDISIVLISSHDSAVSELNIDNSIDQSLLPFLELINKLANFTISSQILYFTDVDFNSSSDLMCHSVSPAHVPHMISKVEAKLGSTVSQWPRLTFVVYVPHERQRPLMIRNGDSNNTDSFLVPQWGGVIFYNNFVQIGENNTINVDMTEVMPTIIRQLKLLLGLNEHKREDSSTYNLDPWDIDHLIMIQTIERLSLTKLSLTSLIQLLDDVKNMVISDHIQTEVIQSLNNLNKCVSNIADSQWLKAHYACMNALHHAEVAFFDPTILALLYFPDDQKYAIYIPLFLPVGFPVLMSLIKLLKSWRQSRLKEKTA